jgi:uncharacterized cysteine cluster protein YcgN (CxxCxxCC family)
MSKRKKVSVCPKCGRNCITAVMDSESTNDTWELPKYVKHLENTRYEVECPGCGAHYIADIGQAVPCWEEIEE